MNLFSADSFNRCDMRQISTTLLQIKIMIVDKLIDFVDDIYRSERNSKTCPRHFLFDFWIEARVAARALPCMERDNNKSLFRRGNFCHACFSGTRRLAQEMLYASQILRKTYHNRGASRLILSLFEPDNNTWPLCNRIACRSRIVRAFRFL